MRWSASSNLKHVATRGVATRSAICASTSGGSASRETVRRFLNKCRLRYLLHRARGSVAGKGEHTDTRVSTKGQGRNQVHKRGRACSIRGSTRPARSPRVALSVRRGDACGALRVSSACSTRGFARSRYSGARSRRERGRVSMERVGVQPARPIAAEHYGDRTTHTDTKSRTFPRTFPRDEKLQNPWVCGREAVLGGPVLVLVCQRSQLADAAHLDGAQGCLTHRQKKPWAAPT